MTRLASILGVATVATLILLSGCEAAVTTDYAKDLEGAWSTEFDRMIPLNPNMPSDLTAVTTAVTADVTRTGTNKGSVSLTIADTPSGLVATTTVTGDIEVTSTEITVSGIMVNPMAVLAAVPGGAELVAQDQTLTYTLSDDGSELTVSAALFTALLTVTEVELTKEPASAATR